MNKEEKRRKLDILYDSEPALTQILTHRILKKHLKNKNILDVGCWTGQFEKLIRNDAKKITGVDPGSEAIEYANALFKKNKNIVFKVGVAQDLPFNNSKFDVVLFIEVIEHLQNNDELRAIQEIRRVLKKKGTLLLTTPHKNLLSILLDPAYFLINHRHYSEKYLVSLLQNNGFEIVNIQKAGGFFSLTAAIIDTLYKHIFGGKFQRPQWLVKKITNEYKHEGYERIIVVAKAI